MLFSSMANHHKQLYSTLKSLSVRRQLHNLQDKIRVICPIVEDVVLYYDIWITL